MHSTLDISSRRAGDPAARDALPAAGPAGLRFDAIVLAADRTRDDPVAAEAKVAAKCLAPLGGTPMAVRVVRALEESGRVDTILLCGPTQEALNRSPELHRMVSGGRVRWMAPDSTPAASAATALAALPEERPTLLTTGDHALLRPDMVRHFLDHASALAGDVAVALAPHELVLRAYPRTRRTVLKFRDGHYCGCNLFAFLTPRGRDMARVWQQVEAQRKKPVRVVRLVGWTAVVLYALRLLSLAGALQRLSARASMSAGVVALPFAEAAIDVDTIADLELARSIIERGAY